MADVDRRSLFLFRFRLFPAYFCRNLSFWGVGPPRAQFVCTRDSLGVEIEEEPGDVRPLLMRAKTFASAFIDVHAYLSFETGPALDVLSEGWIEIKRGGGLEMIVGYSEPSLEGEPLDRDHPDNQPFLDSTGLFNRVFETPGLGAVLADFRAARRSTANYSPIFAYRALEGVATSISGITDPTRRNRAWEVMNNLFRTSREEDWDPLVRASEAARHGNPLAGENVTPERRDELLHIAKRGIDSWISHLTGASGSAGPVAS